MTAFHRSATNNTEGVRPARQLASSASHDPGWRTFPVLLGLRIHGLRHLKDRFTLRNLPGISPALPSRLLKTRSVSRNLWAISLKNKEKLTLMSYIRPCCDASKPTYNKSTLLASNSVAAHATDSSQTRFISRKLTWPSIKTTSRQLPV